MVYATERSLCYIPIYFFCIYTKKILCDHHHHHHQHHTYVNMSWAECIYKGQQELAITSFAVLFFNVTL